MKMKPLIALLHVVLLSGCQQRNVQTWQTAGTGDDRSKLSARAPEQSADLDGWSFDPEQDIGLAFSAAIGQLRALKHDGLLKRVKYVSTVSGGTWGVLPWVYLSSEHANTSRTSKVRGQRLSQEDLDNLYLGTYLKPEQLTLAHLEAMPRPGSGLWSNCNTRFGIRPILKGDENYSTQVAHSFLHPIGLNDDRRHVAWSESYVNKHLLNKPGNERLKVSDFYFPAPGRPFLIANGALARRQSTNLGVKLMTMFLKSNYRRLSEGYWPLEMTPLYTGLAAVSERNPAPFQMERELGGGFLETTGFNFRFHKWDSTDPSRAIVKSRQSLFPRQQSAFSLADMMGASGSAPAAMLSEFTDIFGFQPEFYIWSQRDLEKTPPNGMFDVPVVDGGACDNSGGIQLIAHGVKKIIVFANSASLFRYDSSKPPSLSETHDTEKMDSISTVVTSYFGVRGIERERNEYLANPRTNHVLCNAGGKPLHELELAFWKAAKAGRPLIHTGTYKTLDCPRYNVKGGSTVRITWVYPGTENVTQGAAETVVDGFNMAWVNQLPPDAQTAFTVEKEAKRQKLSKFPALNVFWANFPHIQTLKPIQANALAHYHAFNLNQMLPNIRRDLGVR